MPIKVEIEGVEKEVFTQEELDAQKQTAIEDFKKANPDKSDELTKLQTELKTKDEELKGLKDKDFNFGNLRKEKEILEGKIKDLTTSVDEKIGSVKKEILEGVMLDHKNDILNKLSGGDKELLEKIKLKYDKDLGSVTAATKEEITKKLSDALLLATGGTAEGGGSGAFGSGGVGRLPNDKGQQKLTAEEKAMAKDLAARGGMTITDKDLEGK